MNQSERLIKDYLAHAGYSEVVHEPDGNHPPDFLVNGRIAVEVRRLNQNVELGTERRGVEEIAIPLNRSVRKVLASLGPPVDNRSWFVCYSVPRLFQLNKDFERSLRTTLSHAVVSGIEEGQSVPVARGFSLRLYRASHSHPTRFLLGGWTDHNTGGFVVAELARNLTICAAEKTEKIARVRSKYPEWWLALDDRIGYGSLDSNDREQLRTVFRAEAPWDRIILVNPMDAMRGFDL
jgi:hypothetical protein